MLHQNHLNDDQITDEEDDSAIDPNLRLRTVRTAASALTESIAVEKRASRRRTMINKKKKSGRFFRRGAEKKRSEPGSASDAKATSSPASGPRRNIYVNCSPAPPELDSHGEPIARYARNKVRTTSK
jgi:phospholipid-translocating ATPase